MQTVALDLTQSFYDRIGSGRLRVIGTWVKIPGESHTPCIVLLDANVRPGTHPPYVIPLDGIWRWIEESNDNDLEIAQKAMDVVLTMNRTPTNQEMVYVLDNVRDAVDALVQSDVWQHVGPTLVVGEATVTDLLTGQKEQREIKLLN